MAVAGEVAASLEEVHEAVEDEERRDAVAGDGGSFLAVGVPFLTGVGLPSKVVLVLFLGAIVVLESLLFFT